LKEHTKFFFNLGALPNILRYINGTDITQKPTLKSRWFHSGWVEIRELCGTQTEWRFEHNAICP